MLVVVNGPIAAGKSVFSFALAEHLRSLGRSAVVLDLDEVVTALEIIRTSPLRRSGRQPAESTPNWCKHSWLPPSKS